MTTFAEVVLKQFREVLKAIFQQAEEEMFMLADSSKDLFFRTHACDVLSALRSETLAIQLSFCHELRKKFKTFLRQDETVSLDKTIHSCDRLLHWSDSLNISEIPSVQSCQQKWRSLLDELALTILSLKSGAVSPTITPPLPIGPVDVITALFQALDSIRLPVHTHIKRSLAELIARQLDERAGTIYGEFADALPADRDSWEESAEAEYEAESAPVLMHTLTFRQNAPEPDPEPSSPKMPAASPGTGEMSSPSSIAARKPAFSLDLKAASATLAKWFRRFAANTGPEERHGGAAPELSLIDEEIPPSLGERLEALIGHVRTKRIVVAGTIYLLCVMAVLGLNREWGGDEPTPSAPEQTAAPSSVHEMGQMAVSGNAAPESPASLPPPAAQDVPPSTDVAGADQTLGDEETPVVADLAEAQGSLVETDPGPQPIEPQDETPKPAALPKLGETVTQPAPMRTPNVDDSAPRRPVVAMPDSNTASDPRKNQAELAGAALRKIKLKGYDWVRDRADKTIRMQIRIYNGSASRVRKIRINCDGYSDNLSRLESFGRTLEQVIPAGASTTIKDVNLGKKHKNITRITCKVNHLEAF